MHAVVFCINLSLFNRCLGSPYSKELQLSSLELMCVCAKISEVNKYFQIYMLVIFLFAAEGA